MLFLKFPTFFKHSLTCGIFFLLFRSTREESVAKEPVPQAKSASLSSVVGKDNKNKDTPNLSSTSIKRPESDKPKRPKVELVSEKSEPKKIHTMTIGSKRPSVGDVLNSKRPKLELDNSITPKSVDNENKDTVYAEKDPLANCPKQVKKPKFYDLTLDDSLQRVSKACMRSPAKISLEQEENLHRTREVIPEVEVKKSPNV